MIDDASDARDIYFLLEGQLHVVSNPGGDDEVLLARILPGAAVGEMAFYSHRKRSAAIKANERSRLIRLDSAKIEALEEDNPKVAVALHRLLARDMALRLHRTNDQLLALDT